MTTLLHSCDLTATEVYDSLNGFDELAIVRAFSTTIESLAARDEAGNPRTPNQLGRALAFIHRRRLGDKDTQAYTAAMGLTNADVQAYFKAEDPGADADLDAEGNDPSAS